MYWYCLVKMDVGPIFCINLVRCVHLKAERPIYFFFLIKRHFSIWQFLGLERTLLSKMHHIICSGATFYEHENMNGKSFSIMKNEDVPFSPFFARGWNDRISSVR